MEIKQLKQHFKCDGWQCDQLGVIRFNETSRIIKSHGTWFKYDTQGCGIPLDFCSKKCLCERVDQQGMTLQTVITIKSSYIENEMDNSGE